MARNIPLISGLEPRVASIGVNLNTIRISLDTEHNIDSGFNVDSIRTNLPTRTSH